jgi:hypothetical protein
LKSRRGVSTDLPIPATAEVVLEGEMLPPAAGAEIEGPFGEASGYYGGGARPSAITKIHSIIYRDNPIIMAIRRSSSKAAGRTFSIPEASTCAKSSEGLGIPASKASIINIPARSSRCSNPIRVTPCVRRWAPWAAAPAVITADGDRRRR